MTSDEIKEKYDMSDLLSMYSIKANRAGFIHCPLHRDKTASMKIYKDSFHCFACGADGDIFSFVQIMDGVDFRTAYQCLGGTYEHKKKTSGFSDGARAYEREKRREMERKREYRERFDKELNNKLITIYRNYLPKFEPLSPAWCDTYNNLFKQLVRHAELNGMEEGGVR